MFKKNERNGGSRRKEDNGADVKWRVKEREREGEGEGEGEFKVV